MEKLKKRKIREYLWGTWDRRYTFLSSCLSAISIVITIILWKFPGAVPVLIIIRDIIIFFGLITICGVLLAKYIRKEQSLSQTVDSLKISNENLSKLSLNFHSVNHEFRNEFFSHFFSKVKNKAKLTQADRHRFEKMCHSITTEVKKTFIEFFKSNEIDISNDIVITVKLTISSSCILDLYGSKLNEEQNRKIEDKEEWVLTAYRDPGSYEAYKGIREVGLKLYDIDKNTAFIHIFRQKKNVFRCNNLKSLGSTYLNENTTWQDYYNSTAVAPIRYYDDNADRYMYYGMIAVDSKNEKNLLLYENEETSHILGHAADLLANYFLVLDILPIDQPED